MVNTGDRVLLVSGGVSVFEVLEVRDDRALVEAVEKDAPGCYPFETPIHCLAPVDVE